MKAQLEFAVVEPGETGRIEEQGRRILGAGGAAGESGAETAHALFAQLEAAGASIYGRVDNEEGFWLIMQDPEGNEFCVN